MDTWKQRSLTYWTVQTSQLPLEGWEAIHIDSICAAKWVPENRQSPSEDSLWDGRGGGITPFVMGEWGLISTLSLALCVLKTSSQQSSALSWPASLSLLSLLLGPLSPFFTLNFSFLDSWAFSREASLAFTSLLPTLSLPPASLPHLIRSGVGQPPLPFPVVTEVFPHVQSVTRAAELIFFGSQCIAFSPSPLLLSIPPHFSTGLPQCPQIHLPLSNPLPGWHLNNLPKMKA